MEPLYPEIINKYTNGFMYTDYPHKSTWKEDFDDTQYRDALKKLFIDQNSPPTMLYVHIPFCHQLCTFCLCHKIITRNYDKMKKYMGYLFREIDMLREFFDEHSITPNFQEIHLGGGSPSVLDEPEFDQLIEKMGTIVDYNKLTEFALEIDPRNIFDKKDRLPYYASKGIDRISMGIQDFDPLVQKAINRIQPTDAVVELLKPEHRNLFTSLNFDILVGLAKQTRESFRKTIEIVNEIGPDRIDLAFYNHRPDNFSFMKVLKEEDRPNDVERHQLFLDACEGLLQGGYDRIGFDHFAKPTDRQAQAMKEQKLRWNSLGFSPGACRDMVGIGESSGMRITENYYFQNVYETEDYERAIDSGKFPIFRGLALGQDDIIRRDVVNRLRSYYFVDYNDIEKEYGIVFKDYFSDEQYVVEMFAQDGMVEFTDSRITVTEIGRHFCNLVCRIFDNYNRGENFPENFFAHNRSNDYGVTNFSQPSSLTA
jgi:oxygen-independent coproporphyrinogen III oxidase